MSRIFWDTNLFIHLFEGEGERAEQVVALRERMIERQDHLLTSALTLGEVLAKPLAAGDGELMRRYKRAITTSATVLPFDQTAASAFASIQRNSTIHPVDAMQLACASATGVDLFITNDERLSRHMVPGIHFIQSLAVAQL